MVRAKRATKVIAVDVHFDRRAMVAIRSLDPRQRADIEGVVDRLAQADVSNWAERVHAKPLQSSGGEQLYSVGAGTELRILSKIISGALIVQDVFARERLEQISGLSL